MERMINFEWYVMNETPNRNGKIEPFNVFNNISVYNAIVNLCDRMWLDLSLDDYYFEDKMTDCWNQFVEDVRRIFQWQEWARCEYEIMVSPLYRDTPAQKIDCYQQLAPNMGIIAKYIWATYLDQVPKEHLDTLEED